LALWLLCRHVNKKKLIAFLLGLDTIANIKYIVIIIFVILLLACSLVRLLVKQILSVQFMLSPHFSSGVKTDRLV
jgi:hypothetical protein